MGPLSWHSGLQQGCLCNCLRHAFSLSPGGLGFFFSPSMVNISLFMGLGHSCILFEKKKMPLPYHFSLKPLSPYFLLMRSSISSFSSSCSFFLKWGLTYSPDSPKNHCVSQARTSCLKPSECWDSRYGVPCKTFSLGK